MDEQEPNHALWRLLPHHDLRVLAALLLVGTLALVIGVVVRGDDLGPDPDAVAACEGWVDLRGDLAAGRVSADGLRDRLERLAGPMRPAGPEPATFEGFVREVVDDGPHADNYAARLDDRCERLLRRSP